MKGRFSTKLLLLACTLSVFWLATCAGPDKEEEPKRHFYGPTEMAIAPYTDVEGGPLLFVINSFGANVTILRSESYAIIRSYEKSRYNEDAIWVGPAPRDIAMTPDGALLYITDGNPEPVRTLLPADPWTVEKTALELRGARVSIAPFRTDRATLTTTVPAAWDARHEVWFTDPDGSRLLVWNHAAMRLEAEVALPATPVDLQVSGDGERVYVTGDDATLYVVDAAARALTGAAVVLGGQPHQIVESLDGAEAYVLNYNPPQLHIIDTATWTVADELTSFAAALNGMALSTDGRLGYLAAEDGFVYYFYRDRRRVCGAYAKRPAFFDDGPLGNPQLTAIQTKDCVTREEVWTITYDQPQDAWIVKGESSGEQAALAYTDQAYASDGDEIRFVIRSGDKHESDGDAFQVETRVSQEPVPAGGLPRAVLVSPDDDPDFPDRDVIFVSDPSTHSVARLLTFEDEERQFLE
jgi:sugar lactone lactonase YvrE